MCAGLVAEAAALFELTAAPAGPWSLAQLGWADAVAEGVSSSHWQLTGSS